jgi:hypothetical protein
MALVDRDMLTRVWDEMDYRITKGGNIEHLWIWGKKRERERLTDSQSVSLGVEPHLGLMTRYWLLFDSYGLVFLEAPSLTRGRVCLLYMLLALASVVFLGSEFNILASQIWDFPFRCILRLAGSRWRYSTPRDWTQYWLRPAYNSSAWTNRKLSSSTVAQVVYVGTCFVCEARYPVTALVYLFISRSLRDRLQPAIRWHQNDLTRVYFIRSTHTFRNLSLQFCMPLSALTFNYW